MDREEGVLEGHTDDELALLDPLLWLKLRSDCVSLRTSGICRTRTNCKVFVISTRAFGPLLSP